MRSATGPVRIVDVAALAGVSPGTASKALNGTGQLRAETRERVRVAAAQLGFTPDGFGRGLSSGRSYTVGLLTTDSFGRFTIPVLAGAEDALGAGQMAVLLCDTRDDALREQHYVRMLQSRRVDGILVTGRRTDPRPPLAVSPALPVVHVFTPSEDPARAGLTNTGSRSSLTRASTSSRCCAQSRCPMATYGPTGRPCAAKTSFM